MSEAGGDPVGSIDDLVAEGRRLLAAEREACRRGAFEELATLAEAKEAFVARFASAAHDGAGPAPDRGAVEALLAEARRNETLIGAARAGVEAARRRIASLADLRAGAVAYWRDGSRVVSREDAAGKISRA
jgi:hypothetical protein